MKYLLDIKNLNAQRNHWLGSPSTTNTTGELDRSKLFDLRYLQSMIKNDSLMGFYKSRLWIEARQHVLQRDRNECQRCKRLHRLTTAPDGKGLYIHHICELKKYPQLCLNEAILVTLCWECHETIHGRNQPIEIKPFENFDSNEFII